LGWLLLLAPSPVIEERSRDPQGQTPASPALLCRRFALGDVWTWKGGCGSARLSAVITAGMAKTTVDSPHPPAREVLPLIHTSELVEYWLAHYWKKLKLPVDHLRYLAITENRQEFAEWTGRRLQSMALGCYCYLPLGGAPSAATDRLAAPDNARGAPRGHAAMHASSPSHQPTLPGFGEIAESVASLARDPEYHHAPVGDFRHLIFIEPGMLDRGIEVTVAHELIHLADRVQGRPRKHRCHGNDSISMDEAAITGRDAETLRLELAEETRRREEALRSVRPYKYFYYCPRCKRNYPRVRRYARPVSCGHCFRQYTPDFLLRLRLSPDGPDVDSAFVEDNGSGDSLTE
jgi:hypothetical protein